MKKLKVHFMNVGRGDYTISSEALLRGSGCNIL